MLLNNYHSNGASPDPTVPSSAVLAIAVVGLTIDGAVCSQPANSDPKAHCPGPNPLVVTGTNDADFTVSDVVIKSTTGWADSQGKCI